MFSDQSKLRTKMADQVKAEKDAAPGEASQRSPIIRNSTDLLIVFCLIFWVVMGIDLVGSGVAQLLGQKG